MMILMTALTGMVYPGLVTLVAQGIFPRQANGSVVMRDGMAIGSELIGQRFDQPEYFWGRPSATTPVPYNAASSSGSNWGPTNPALLDAVGKRAQELSDSDHHHIKGIPVDLVTASASGLDPHISPAAAQFQMARVAQARNMPVEEVQRMVADHTLGRTLGVWGEPRVNVLQLNLALDARASSKR